MQTKLAISQPGDEYEQEADRVAEQVMRQSVGLISSSTGDHSPSALTDVPPIIHKVLCSSGEPLDAETRAFMEPRFGYDFSHVRLHADRCAAESARAVNAVAYTLGKDVVMGGGHYASGSPEGRRLLAHELTHVVQQRNVDQRACTGTLQRRIDPEDVSIEMVGQSFEVSEPFTAGAIDLVGGEIVVVITWSNTAATTRVRLPAPYQQAYIPFDIPKRLLRPVAPATPGMAPYSAGISSVVRRVEQGERAIIRLQGQSSQYRTPRARALYRRELSRLQQEQTTREGLLNRRLIQETMFNRFDAVISRWVDHYNQQFGYRDVNALNPNVVKSMLFQESQMGTAGRHLEDPASWPVRARCNIGQVIDSAAAALLIMIQEVQPDLISTYHLENIETDRVRAQQDLRALGRVRNPSASQRARLAEVRRIQDLSRTEGLSFAESFMWEYRAPGQTRGFEEAVDAFFASVNRGQPHRNLDYEFWIRTAIRWLFEKRRTVHSWEDAIRAYNGSGDRARHYRDAVRGRARAATAAERAGREHVPDRI
ncbi:MAG: DUF4157 domain-containing protein [Phycisphaerales bacterium]